MDCIFTALSAVGVEKLPFLIGAREGFVHPSQETVRVNGHSDKA
jgi:hypothetical protein